MKWLLAFIVITVAKIAPSQMMGRSPLTGTCASINHSSQCCPPRPLNDLSACQAKDGSCRCDTLCHIYEECCSDHNCSKGKASASVIMSRLTV